MNWKKCKISMYIVRLAFTIFVSWMAFGFTQCPQSSLEPTLNFGNQFAGAKAINESFNKLDLLKTGDVVFHYYEYGSKDGDFDRIFMVALISDKDTNSYNAVLYRVKKKEISVEKRGLSKEEVDRVLNFAEPIVLATHYSKDSCPQMYLDGFVIEAASLTSLFPFEIRGGVAYSPLKGTVAFKIAELGRNVKAFIEGQKSQIISE